MALSIAKSAVLVRAIQPACHCTLPKSQQDMPSIHQLRTMRSCCGIRCRLTSLPEALCKLRCLHTLDASGNSLTALPDSIGCMSALRNLQVHHNSITALPDCLASCSRLEHLDACANRLTQLPETLALLQQLSTLILDDNRHAAPAHAACSSSSQCNLMGRT